MFNQSLIFDNTEVTKELRRTFVRLGAPLGVIDELCTLSIARALEDVFLVSFHPKTNFLNDSIIQLANSKYRRFDGDEQYTLGQDVGKLIQKINSSEIPFECSVWLQGDALVLRQTRV